MTKRSAWRNQLLNEVEGAENAGTLPTRIRWLDPGKAKRRAGRLGARRPRPLQSGSGARHHPPFTADPIRAERAARGGRPP